MKHLENREYDVENLKEALELEAVPAAVDRRLRRLYAELPDEVPTARETKSPRRGLRRLAYGVSGLAAAFLLLFGANTVNPAFAEGLPVVGRFFQAVNDGFRETLPRGKTIQGTNVLDYGAQDINVTAESAGSRAAVEKAFSDGRSLVFSLKMDIPSEIAEKINSFYPAERTLTVNGAEAEPLDGIGFFPAADGSYTGAVLCDLPQAVEDGAPLNVSLRMSGFTGGDKTKKDDDPGSDIAIDGAFALDFSMTADASCNREFSCDAADGDVKLLGVKTTPVRTCLTVAQPYWGGDSNGPYGKPALYLEDGSRLKYNAQYSGSHGYDPFSEEAQTADQYFDGVPKGTKAVVFRFYKTENDMDRQVLAEFTVDLEKGTAAPSRTYEEDGPLNLEAAFDYRYLSSRELPYDPGKLTNGFMVSSLHYAANDSVFTVSADTPGEYKEILAEVLTADGQVVASTVSQYGTLYENENWYWDEDSPFWEGYSKTRGGDKAPHAYQLELYSQNYQPARNETMTVRLTDNETGEEILTQELTLDQLSH